MTRHKNVIELKDVDRERIRHYVEKIKIALEVADFPSDRREKLLEELNAFLAEVDKSRTSMQAVAAMWITVCSAVGEGFAHLEPARKWLDDIATIMGAAKAISHDVKALPAPGTQALPAPSEGESKPLMLNEACAMGATFR